MKISELVTPVLASDPLDRATVRCTPKNDSVKITEIKESFDDKVTTKDSINDINVEDYEDCKECCKAFNRIFANPTLKSKIAEFTNALETKITHGYLNKETLLANNQVSCLAKDLNSELKKIQFELSSKCKNTHGRCQEHVRSILNLITSQLNNLLCEKKFIQLKQIEKNYINRPAGQMFSCRSEPNSISNDISCGIDSVPEEQRFFQTLPDHIVNNSYNKLGSLNHSSHLRANSLNSRLKKPNLLNLNNSVSVSESEPCTEWSHVADKASYCESPINCSGSSKNNDVLREKQAQLRCAYFNKMREEKWALLKSSVKNRITVETCQSNAAKLSQLPSEEHKCDNCCYASHITAGKPNSENDLRKIILLVLACVVVGSIVSCCSFFLMAISVRLTYDLLSSV